MNRGLYFENTPQRMGYEGLMMDYWDKKISFCGISSGSVSDGEPKYRLVQGVVP